MARDYFQFSKVDGVVIVVYLNTLTQVLNTLARVDFQNIVEEKGHMPNFV